MAANTIWQEEAAVKSSETDFQNRLKLSSFFILMQDVASDHASHLGVGYQAMLKREMAWVLSRKKVRFIDFPRLDEKITVLTWPKGIQQKLFFMRDHQVTGMEGRMLALSTSAYVLVSTRARRILTPNALDIPVPDNDGKSAIDEPLDRIPAVNGLSECFTTRAGYSVVDLMGHVNNARYIDWISDCFSIEEYQQRQPEWLQINYLNEVRPGETVSVQRGQRPGDPLCWYIAGMNQNSGAKAFEAELKWK